MHVHRKSAKILGTKKARALQQLTWKEIRDELKANVPEVQAGLDDL